MTKKSDSKSKPKPKATPQNGKGDSPRNNFSINYKKNYDSINWKKKS